MCVCALVTSTLVPQSIISKNLSPARAHSTIYQQKFDVEQINALTGPNFRDGLWAITRLLLDRMTILFVHNISISRFHSLSDTFQLTQWVYVNILFNSKASQTFLVYTDTDKQSHSMPNNVLRHFIVFVPRYDGLYFIYLLLDNRQPNQTNGCSCSASVQS